MKMITVCSSLALFACLLPAAAEEERRYPQQHIPPPANWKAAEVPPDAPEYKASDEELKQGFALFSRPLTEPVYPASRPRNFERIARLRTFGTPGQFVTFNFALYPLRELQNIRVKWSFVAGAEQQTRLLTYWKTRYPMYTSTGTYRTLPEYLFPVTVNDAPAGVPQRYLLTLRIPDDATGGTVYGAVEISSANGGKVAKLGLELEILPFKLKKDPNKHYSAYQTTLESVPLLRERGKEFCEQTFSRELAIMRDYGIDRAPRMHLGYNPKQEKFTVGELPRMLKAVKTLGFDPTLTLTGCGIHSLYAKHTGKTMGAHHRIPVDPPESMYQELDRALGRFRQECEANNYPEMIMGPLDEVDPSAAKMAERVYGLFKKHKFTTFTTKDPVSDRSAAQLDHVIDIWSSQPYSWSYDEIKKGNKKAYWCYPNHNSFEIKDPVVMCKGGRMTYGYGNYRSGYDFLMPWIWRRTQPDFISPAPGGDSGANWLNERGEVIISLCWEAFRLGIDDARYIYTLQDAIVKREKSSDAACASLVTQGRSLLQELWDAIPVQSKYLSENMWPDEEFDVWRYRVGKMTAELLKYPETDGSRIAPSVLPQPRTLPRRDEFSELCRKGIADGSIVKYVLPPGDMWRGQEKEAHVTSTTDTVKFEVKVDHKNDGSGGGGRHRMNWPRLSYNFGRGGFDLGAYDMLNVRFRVRSNRNETRNARTPFWSVCGNWRDNFGTATVGEVFPEGEWRHAVIPLRQLLGTASRELTSKVKHLQFGITESMFEHGDYLCFEFADIWLLKTVRPKMLNPEVPSLLLPGSENIKFRVEIFGPSSPGEHRIVAELRDAKGLSAARKEFPCAGDLNVYGLPLPGSTPPGTYKLTLELRSGNQLLDRRTASLRIL